MGKLTVFLDKVTNLQDEDLAGKSDPYVRFTLEQDNWTIDKNFGKQSSSKKKGDLSPVYKETFVFDDVPSLKNMVLHCKVMDDDPLMDDKLGYCKIKLEDLGLSEQMTGCDRVVDNNLISKDARIFLQLKYEE